MDVPSRCRRRAAWGSTRGLRSVGADGTHWDPSHAWTVVPRELFVEIVFRVVIQTAV